MVGSSRGLPEPIPAVQVGCPRGALSVWLACPRFVLVLVAALAAPPDAAADERRSFRVALTDGSMVSFRAPGVRPHTIRAARLTVGRRSRRLSARAVRAGLRRGTLLVRLPRSGPRHGPVRLVLRTRNFPEFDGYSASGGALMRSARYAFHGRTSTRASYDGHGVNAFQRVWYNVAWAPGAAIRYGVALYVPSGRSWCWWRPARWDNHRLYGARGDVGGLRVERGRLLVDTGRYGGATRTLVGPVSLPKGRWVRLEVRQRLSSIPGMAFTQLHVNGVSRGFSRAANSGGRPITHIRFGNVTLASECSRAGSIYFDRPVASQTATPGSG